MAKKIARLIAALKFCEKKFGRGTAVEDAIELLKTNGRPKEWDKSALSQLFLGVESLRGAGLSLTEAQRRFVKHSPDVCEFIRGGNETYRKHLTFSNIKKQYREAK